MKSPLVLSAQFCAATFAVKLNLGKEDDLLSAYAWIVIVAIIDY